MSVDVSDHAKLRWMQRVGTVADDVATRIREQFERATPTDRHVDDGRGWRVGDLILVTDPGDDIVRTVLVDRGGER